MTEPIHLVCAHCLAINRVAGEKLQRRPQCGRCHKALFAGQPVELTATNFDIFLKKNDLPVLVDFWASWCGPCKAMAPAFAAAADDLEPHMRSAKLNTETAGMISGRYQIRSIPTLVLFQRGVELARQPGALTRGQIVQWARAQIG